ncbi:UNVERIFIED_CONTAM: LysM peptidoglycan-binding domain-containing protein [Streptococcus canis]|uniref:LysM domain-containing protein n=1 Tax=Streptococcus canis TaxID=1329 RepID=A0A3P5Y5S8_STRCB|nr:SAG1386/EF1546 family surface-associated protein [Streptococcus canis]MDV5973718.1 LysM peptidoglycan-binding domain-containing protein [Streptococcus canis]QKG77331.1 LysM peptidoglycan-binding domain-containing protein [Streptococcus canis]VDC43126.1 hypothetical protein FMV2238Y02_16130 [Streptococcus canis]
MAKEPWEEKIVDDNKETRTRQSRSALISTPWLTALLSIFFVVIVAILFIFFYTSNSGSDKQAEITGFYGASTHKKVKKASSTKKTTSSSTTKETTASGEEPPASTEAASETITVLAGEGAASIAARAGISVEQLQALNPDHMTQGYWYANPGDQVIIK